MAAGTAVQIATTSAHVSAGGRRTRETNYRVITTDPYDGSVAVLAASGLPTIGQVYGDLDTGCVCIDLIPDRISRYVWHVTAIFSTEYESIDQILKEPPEVDFPSEPGEEPMIGQEKAFSPPPADTGSNDNPFASSSAADFNKTGRGIINSAGNLYDPPATRRIATPLVRISRNEPESGFSLARKVLYENSVNRSTWNGLASRQAFCRLYSAQAMYFTPPVYTLNRIAYWRVTYEFALKFETWDLILPDAGPWHLQWTGGTAYRKPFQTPEGTQYIGLLDHSDSTKPGQKLSSTADCQYNRWRRYRENDFSALNINLNLSLLALMPTPRGYRPFPDSLKTPITVAS